MPGIAGIVSRKSPDECRHLVQTMLECMSYESFYVSGTHSNPDLGVYGGWVANQGSFPAGQVFSNPQKDITLLFAGECFKHSEEGTQTTESGDWLVRFYEKEGDSFFEKLNGLFSGLLIDKRRNRAFLFNDRYGIERIYVYEAPDGVYFASEAKALLDILPETRTFDEKGVVQFLTFGCTLEWQTLFRGLQLLPGGSLWSLENGTLHKDRYFLPERWEAQSPLAADEFEAEFQAIFKGQLPLYFESSSKVGISLTGGLDTRMIMACRPENRSKPICYTFAGVKGETLDSRLAAQIARVCGLDHENLRIGEDFFSNFATYADKTVYVTDGCFGVVGSHEIYLNRKARALAPIRVTGNFGSEILRGMSTFKPLQMAPDLFSPEVGRLVDSCAAQYPRSEGSGVAQAAFREIPWNLFGSLSAGRSQITFRTPYLDNEIVALAFRAPENLRRSPAASLHLVQNIRPLLSKIPTDRGLAGSNGGIERFFRRLFCDVTFKLDYIYSEGMPQWLAPFDPLFGSLNGFGILGLHKYLLFRRWFRGELAPYLRDVLADGQASRFPYWNSAFRQRMALDHISGRKNYVREINAVLTLEAVDRLLLRGASPGRRNV